MIALPSVTLFYIQTEKDFFAALKCEERAQFYDTVFAPNPGSYDAYNQFMIRGLHECFDSSHILTVQWDGFIINPDAWSDEFLEYDYIGAPWDIRDPLKGEWPNARVGNGGFSLRSKKFCEASSRIPQEIIKWREEDQSLCRDGREWMELQGIRYAPIELAAKFSWEKNNAFPTYNNSFGFHGSHTMEWLKQNTQLLSELNSL